MLLEKAVTKNTYSQQGVSYLIQKHTYWKHIFYGWNMAQYFFHRYIWEVYCNSPILLLFDMFILPLSWSLRKEKKVILLMGILMVAMTVSNRGIASFFFQTLYWSISKHWEKDVDTNWKQKSIVFNFKQDWFSFILNLQDLVFDRIKIHTQKINGQTSEMAIPNCYCKNYMISSRTYRW